MLAIVCFSYLLMGCFIEGICMVIITVPIVYPVMVSLGFDPIWFGILVVRAAEIGLITPPVGMNVFIIKGIAKDVPMFTIFRGIFPFIMADLCHVALILSVPQVALFLPNLMS